MIESVLLGLAGGGLALGGCSGAGHRPDPNHAPDAAQVADAGSRPADARPVQPDDERRRHWRYRRRNQDPNATPMPYMAPDAAPLHVLFTNQA